MQKNSIEKLDCLSSKRLHLQPISLDHAPFFLKLFNTTGYKENIKDRGIRNLGQAERFLQKIYLSNEHTVYVLFTKSNQQFVGSCGLYKRNELTNRDLGYAIMPQHYRNNFAFEASQCLISHVQKQEKDVAIDAITGKTNLASQGVLKKLGFSHLGLRYFREYDEELMHYRL